MRELIARTRLDLLADALPTRRPTNQSAPSLLARLTAQRRQRMSPARRWRCWRPKGGGAGSSTPGG